MNKSTKNILLIEAENNQEVVLRHSLGKAGYEYHRVTKSEEGLRRLKEENYDLVIIDLHLEQTEAVNTFKDIKSSNSKTRILAISALCPVDQAIAALKEVDVDYLFKPFNSNQFLLAVYKALFLRKSEPCSSKSTNPNGAIVSPVLLGHSKAVQNVKELIGRMTNSSAPVLILGESGTGKELAARLLHVQSERKSAPFLAINCAALPGNLLEAELFGHVRGSFTGAVRDHQGKFEAAQGGVLFLDEIGEMPLELQPKLLRALQEQEIVPVGGETRKTDVRIVAATNCDLEKLVKEGKFRSDLYYRLAVLPLAMPPLRARKEDIALLANYFLSQFDNRQTLQLSPKALKVLQEYSWPGNVRELENLMKRIAVLTVSGSIEEEDLPSHIKSYPGENKNSVVHLPPDGFPLRDIERQAIMQALVATGGNLTKAASFLSVPRHILAYRINKYAMEDVS